MTFDNIELEPIRNNEIIGIVLQPGIADGQNQVVSEQEVEEACLLWNEKFEHLTVQHRDRLGSLLNLEELSNPETFKDCFDSDFSILSSYIVDSDSILNNQNIPGGSWLLSLEVKNPEIWELIKERELLKGFSIGALGVKNPNGAVNISSLIVPEISLVASPANKRKFLIVKQLETILNPFISEFSCRISDPGGFVKSSFRRIEREKDGKKFSIIIAKRPGKDTTEAQAFRYPVSDWTKQEAQGHCGRQGGTFEDIKREEE